VTGDTPETIQDKLSDLAPDDRLLIAFPFDALRGAPWGRQLVSQGFLRIFAGGKIVDLEGLGKDEIEALSGSEVLAVVDRLLWGKAERGRVADSIATAFRMGDGRVSVVVMPDRIRRFSSDLSCPDCPGSAAIPPATPNLFSFNSPLGACPHAGGSQNDRGGHGIGDPRPQAHDLAGSDKALGRGPRGNFELLEF